MGKRFVKQSVSFEGDGPVDTITLSEKTELIKRNRDQKIKEQDEM